MSRDARVELDWADGTYSFRLAWAQLAELQDKCNAGPYVILTRLEDNTWRVEDISNTLRLGLIGGGMAPADALKMARTYIEARPPMENLIPARLVLMAALMGSEDEPLGNVEGASLTESASTISPTAS